MRLPIVILAGVVLLSAAIPVAAQDPPPQAFVQKQKSEGPDSYLVPYWASNAGGKLLPEMDTSDSTGFGVGFTWWARGALSAEIDFNYNKQFFGDIQTIGNDNNLLTVTFNGIIGPWITAGPMRIRPYGVFGGGLMRSSIKEFATVGWSSTKNMGVLDAGGGLLWLFTRNIGVRGDYRYRWGVGAKGDEDGWGLIDSWTYYRISAGLALAF